MRAAPMTAVRRARKATAAAVAVALVLGFLATSVVSARPAAAYPLGAGYWLVARDGGVFAFGDAQFAGSAGAVELNSPVVGAAAVPFLEGYWLVGADGGVFAFGSAGFFGSTGHVRLNRPIVAMTAHPSAKGYHLVASDGGVFSFGAARFSGSMGGTSLNQPVVGMASTPSGNGYWLVARDGGIFAFGDAPFLGSTGGIPLNQPIVGMAASPTGRGYWLVASDGGIFAFGDAAYHGSTGAMRLNKAIVGMAPTATGDGYWVTASDGGVFAFGQAQFLGGTGSMALASPIVAIAARPPLAVKVDPFDGDRPGRTQTWEPKATRAADYELALTWDGNGAVPAGARVVGAEGLTVAQLRDIKFQDEAGSCAGEPRFDLYADTDGDGRGDVKRSYTCSEDGPRPDKVFDPRVGTASQAPLPGAAVVTALDVVLGAAGTARLDHFRVAGIAVTDYRTFTAADTVLG